MADKSDAWLDGWFAHKECYETDGNPYSETSQKRSHQQWVAGWCARHIAVEHGFDKSLDETLFDD